MSEKRKHSIAFISSSTDSSSENLILSTTTESTRKRWKSSNNTTIIEQSSNRGGGGLVLLTNGNSGSTTTMTEFHEIQASSPENSNSTPTPTTRTAAIGAGVENSKSVRYDRQLRLWGDHGQELLESAHVCLLNATALGTEILKSLILPGVGAFTIFDGHEITGDDLGSNFFLESSYMGESRAKVARDLLQELNPDVRGHYVDSSIETAIVKDGPSVLDRYTVVIGTNLRRTTIATLADYLFDRRIPFLMCQTNGMVGYVRLLVNEHPIVESHPDNPSPNLMLDQPFKELVRYVEAIDLATLNHKDHSHTPYLVLLFKALDVWRSKKNDDDGGAPPTNAFPRTYKEKKELKEILLSMRQPDENESLDEENFQEAVSSVNASVVETVLPREVRAILDDPSAVDLSVNSSNYWILCNALGRFVREHGRLPIRGVLPDMISDSERYIQLQNVFLHKADEEAASVHSYALDTSRSFDRRPELSSAETRQFCKNAAFLRIIRNRQTMKLDDDFGMRDRSFVGELASDENTNALWYLVMNECDDVLGVRDRYPCSTEDHFDDDKRDLMRRVRDKVKKLVATSSSEPVVVTKLESVVDEMCRYGGSEVHTIASFVGGVAAQEAIKLITHQYVPFNNTFVFDGNNGVGSVFSL